MSTKDIYIKAIGNVKKGKMKPEELWEVFEEHLDMKQNEINRLQSSLSEVEVKYHNLLNLVNNAHKEHKKITGD